MPNRSVSKTVISYVICITLLSLLIEVTMGVTVGALSGMRIGSDEFSQQQITERLKAKGIKESDIPKSVFGDEEWYKKLPPDIRKDLENEARRILQDINWFSVTLAVSVFVFAVVGFLGGFLNRAFIPIGILVVLSFLVNNPVVRFPHAKALGPQQKVIIVLAQLAVCYLFGCLGALLGIRRYIKKNAKNEKNENEKNGVRLDY